MLITGMTFDNVIVPIKITDCPVRINKGTVILAGRENSPLIQNCSIRRILEEDSVFEEYSYVFDHNLRFMGYLIYKDKFKVYSIAEKKYTELEDNMTFVRNTNIKLISRLSQIADPIKFQFNGEEYLFKHIIGRVEDSGIFVYAKEQPKLLNILNESEVTVL